MELSIICATYNHENYIPKALDGILMQKINFSFEILIGEDNSNDNSKKILLEYQKKYPNFFKVYYNSYNKGAFENLSFLYEKAKGKYIIVLETDDYWTNPNKLQEQYDILKNNDEIIAVAHNTFVVDKDNQEIEFEYPECKKKWYTFSDFEKYIMAGQTTTIMHKNIYKDDNINKWLLNKKISPGDKKKLFVLLNYGKIYCIQKKMSAYRYITSNGDSYSATYKSSPLKERNFFKYFIEYCKIINSTDEAYSTAEYLFFINSVSALKKKQLKLKELVIDFINLKYKRIVLKKIYHNFFK